MLAIGVSRMAARNAIVRRLPAVEALGSTTIICSDKTGTLTQNQMTVQEIFAGGALFGVTGASYDPEGNITAEDAPVEVEAHPALHACLLAGLLCNDSRLVQEDGQWQVEGDPTEGALLVSARKGGLAERDAAQRYPRLDVVPFESEHQYMATLHETPDGGHPVAYIKGSTEKIVARCESAWDAEGHAGPLDKEALLERLHDMAARGLRVLAMARKEFRSGTTELDHPDLEDGLTLLGLQGMIDPARPEAIAAVASCARAGIRVKMITGDHAITAAAIARQVGIGASDDGESPAAVTGRELDALEGDAFVDAAEKTDVFARVTPEHKLRLVKALQTRGNIVAMTGDGVNDAPALRRADIGVAMAITGTEVAREASDMILTDDNFASIEAAVEEGRGIYDNLRKFMVWTLPTNGGEALIILVAVLLGVALPILPVQILWINMTTAVFLGLMLVFEPKEPDIMARPPRAPRAPIVSRSFIERIVLVSILLCAGAFGAYQWQMHLGATEEQARTVAVTVFVFGEMFYLFNCRSLTKSVWRIGVFSNRWIWAGVATMIALQLVLIYQPHMNRFFHTAAFRPAAWLEILGIGLAIFVIVGIEKKLRGSKRNCGPCWGSRATNDPPLRYLGRASSSCWIILRPSLSMLNLARIVRYSRRALAGRPSRARAWAKA
jgi:cation-transporting P-type ATPase F